MTKESIKKRQLITSALPYISGVKHLGNVIGSMLPADVYARFLRQTGHETLFICATDDHGTPAELAAAKKAQPLPEFCEEQHKIQKDIYEGFGLSFDCFGRTSSQQNIELTQQFYKKLKANGFTEERSMQQIFSIDDDRFLPDRYVEGTCPHCGYENARGDQCESCTKVLDPTDLLEPRSAISGSKNLEVRESTHVFLLQSKLADKIREWVNSQDKWSPLVTSIANKWLDEGLQDRCITRDLKWGVPVPDMENKVFYVWFDAPIGYIGATLEVVGEEETGLWWKKNQENTNYTQFMGKDNIPFHSVMFPATLLGADDGWKMVDEIKGFNWLTYYGGKFSTSQQVGIFTDQALKLLPADYWRYYLLSRTPESADSAFTWIDMQSVINKDLADVLGNYVNRLLKFTEKKFGNKVPTGGEWTEREQIFADSLQKRVDSYTEFLNTKEFRKGMQELREIWALGNQYLADAEPWSIFKENPQDAEAILRTGINFISIIAKLSTPVIPFASKQLSKLVNLSDETSNASDNNSIDGWVSDVTSELKTSGEGRTFQSPQSVIFTKIEDEDVAKYEELFGAEKLAS